MDSRNCFSSNFCTAHLWQPGITLLFLSTIYEFSSLILVDCFLGFIHSLLFHLFLTIISGLTCIYCIFIFRAFICIHFHLSISTIFLVSLLINHLQPWISSFRAFQPISSWISSFLAFKPIPSLHHQLSRAFIINQFSVSFMLATHFHLSITIHSVSCFSAL